MNEQTSAEIATLAGRLMEHADPDVRRLAASALTQAQDHKPGEVPGLPVAGYKPTQSQDAIDRVNRLKVLEEQSLRELDRLMTTDVDPRWLALGRSYIQIGFMCAARAVFQPQRIALPDDPPL